MVYGAVAVGGLNTATDPLSSAQHVLTVWHPTCDNDAVPMLCPVSNDHINLSFTSICCLLVIIPLWLIGTKRCHPLIKRHLAKFSLYRREFCRQLNHPYAARGRSRKVGCMYVRPMDSNATHGQGLRPPCNTENTRGVWHDRQRNRQRRAKAADTNNCGCCCRWRLSASDRACNAQTFITEARPTDPRPTARCHGDNAVAEQPALWLTTLQQELGHRWPVNNQKYSIHFRNTKTGTNTNLVKLDRKKTKWPTTNCKIYVDEAIFKTINLIHCSERWSVFNIPDQKCHFQEFFIFVNLFNSFSYLEDFITCNKVYKT